MDMPCPRNSVWVNQRDILDTYMLHFAVTFYIYSFVVWCTKSVPLLKLSWLRDSIKTVTIRYNNCTTVLKQNRNTKAMYSKTWPLLITIVITLNIVEDTYSQGLENHKLTAFGYQFKILSRSLTLFHADNLRRNFDETSYLLLPRRHTLKAEKVLKGGGRKSF